MLRYHLLLIGLLSLATAVDSRTYGQPPAEWNRSEGCPQGKLIKGTFDQSANYPGTLRKYSVYVPAQARTDQPANLMVFMDGAKYADPNGSFRVPVVFDNLIHQKRMPITIAVFVDPGKIPGTTQDAKDRSNRSFEYDSLGDRYTRFLLDEFLPVALKGLNVSQAPEDRAVCGISSGGICAFTVAWERPDQFGKVLSQIGSYTNIRGGWAYPGLIRKSHRSPKPIKVYLHEGRDDLSNLHGSWPLGNRDMAAALQFAGMTYRLEMTQGGHTGRWAGQKFPEAVEWLWDPNAESTHIPNPANKPAWNPPVEAVANANVPQGQLIEMPAFEDSKVFPGTTRQWWIYVPAQYRSDSPAALMVFQDGQGMSGNWRWRVPTVFDNLIAKGDMPPTIGVFINPGHDKSKPRKNRKHSNRGYEYDSLGDRYARFLIEEILPIVSAKYSISSDPNMRAIGGSSSGAICAFTAAWERPDCFAKVYSNVGSFTHLRGGNIYPALVRKTEPKPLRVYMADTSGDVDNAFGSWPLSNQRMASALSYMGYDVRFDWAEGYGHNPDFGSSKFPEAMRWLWRKDEHTPKFDTSDDLGSDFTLLDLLVPGESWELVLDDLGFADGLCADRKGNLYFSDMRAPGVFRLDAQSGTQTLVCKQAVSGLEFSTDESTLYACQGSKQRILAIDVSSGEHSTIAENIKPNDLAVTRGNKILFTHTAKSEVVLLDPTSGEMRVVDRGIKRPNGISLSNDKGTLAVSAYGGTSCWTFRVSELGLLDAKMPTMPMRLAIDSKGEFRFNEAPPRKTTSRGDGMAVDRAGRYYVTSELGVQIFDPTCRPCGLLPKPDPTRAMTSCILAGPGGNTLYVAQGDRIYRRKLRVDRPQK